MGTICVRAAYTHSSSLWKRTDAMFGQQCDHRESYPPMGCTTGQSMSILVDLQSRGQVYALTRELKRTNHDVRWVVWFAY